MDQELHLKLTLRLLSGEGQRCFGPGIASLLEGVAAHHSLRAAAASMGMAYSKAWRILHTAEEGLGCKLLVSSVGGPHGGGAVLTPQAEALLSAYQTCARDVTRYAEGAFREAFTGLPGFPETKEKKDRC